MRLVRRWWLFPVALATSFVAQKVFFENRYDVSGHAAEHLSSAGAAFAVFAFVAILPFPTPRARREPVLVLAGAARLVGTGLVLVGNFRVSDAVVRAGSGQSPTARPVSVAK